MKFSDEFNDPELKETIAKGKRVLQSDDFDQQLMSKIYAVSSVEKEILNKLNLSLLFFIIGLILGAVLCVSLLYWDSILSFAPKIMSLISLFIILVLGYVMIDNYRRLINLFSDAVVNE